MSGLDSFRIPHFLRIAFSLFYKRIFTIILNLLCFDRNDVTLVFLQSSISYTTLPSLGFSTLGVFPLPSLHELLRISYFYLKNEKLLNEGKMKWAIYIYKQPWYKLFSAITTENVAILCFIFNPPTTSQSWWYTGWPEPEIWIVWTRCFSF